MIDDIIRLLADGVLIVIFFVGTIALSIGVKPKNWLSQAPLAAMAGLTSLLIAKIMSLLYQPSVARPFLEQGVAPGAAYIDNPGFPSDHALLAGVVVCAVYFLTSYKKLAYLLALLAIVMGVARIAALVHTPIDVIGGFFAAAIGALWYWTAKR